MADDKAAGDGASSSSSSSSGGGSEGADDPLVQYIVMRSDLTRHHRYSTGALISNGSHAAIAVIAAHWQEEDVQRYVGRGGGEAGSQMRTVTLAAKDEAELRGAAETLRQHRVAHSLWLEAPEQLPTCLATRPQQRSLVQPLLRHLKLFR